MSKKIWLDNDQEKYERDLITVLSILKRIDISQLVLDLRVNDRKAYDLIYQLMERENGKIR